MIRKELAQIALASLVLVGCAKAERPHNTNITPLLSGSGAPRYIPAEQLPIKQEGPNFIRYTGIPSAEHLQYLERLCGKLQMSQQGPTFMIGTEAPNCEARIRSQRR